jgi:ferric-dicitrate binding protein FerR (iron transport regulator)
MSSIEHLKDLLDDFVSGKISQENAEELFSIINTQDVDSKILAWLYLKWDKTSSRSTGSHSERIYEKIRKNLNLSEKATKEERQYVNHMLNKETGSTKIALNIMKYAAIFVFAVLASLLLFRNSGFILKKTEESYTEIRIENGSKSTIVLPDSTVINLNSGSYLKYPDHFAAENRRVFLEGEAFFNVKPGRAYPFYVKTSTISIKVIGTQFNVKSFSEEQNVETTLLSGNIVIEGQDQGNLPKQQFVLNPNQLAVYNKNTSRMNILELDTEEELTLAQPISVTSLQNKQMINTNAGILTAWKDNKLVFSNEKLDDLSLRLERWYNVEIQIEDKDIKDYRFTGSFTTENIAQVLEALKLASSFEYQIDKNRITITK